MAEDRETEQAPARWWVAVLAAVALLIGVDAVVDYFDGHSVHIVVEVMAMLAVLGVVGAMIRRREVHIHSLEGDLTRSRREAERWREEAQHALEGLGTAIQRQFDRWELSPAEREVGLLLLKGLSFKDVAKVRATSERTARDQARAVYRKAGLGGRSELSAFFLEDLLLPAEAPAS